MRWAKNLFTGPDGESLSVAKVAMISLVATCLGVIIASSVWLYRRPGALISDWALLLQSYAVFIAAFTPAAIALGTLQSSNEGGLLKAHGIRPSNQKTESQDEPSST